MKQYNVTRKFTAGPLNGLTHTAITTVAFEVGYVCKMPCGGSPYVIVSVEAVA